MAYLHPIVNTNPNRNGSNPIYPRSSEMIIHLVTAKWRCEKKGTTVKRRIATKLVNPSSELTWQWKTIVLICGQVRLPIATKRQTINSPATTGRDLWRASNTGSYLWNRISQFPMSKWFLIRNKHSKQKMGKMFCFLSYFHGIPQKSMVYRPIPHVTATVTTAWRSCWPKWRQEPGFSTNVTVCKNLFRYRNMKQCAFRCKYVYT